MARLQAGEALALLHAIVRRLQDRPKQASRLVVWLRSVLYVHGRGLSASASGRVSSAAARDSSW